MTHHLCVAYACTCVDVVCQIRPSISPQSVAPAITGDLTFSKNNPEEGEATTATCTWSGDPAPTGQWFKDGRLLVESELPGHMRISPVSSGSVLKIFSVMLIDAGNYTCNVSNLVGFDFQVERLVVQGDWHVNVWLHCLCGDDCMSIWWSNRVIVCFLVHAERSTTALITGTDSCYCISLCICVDLSISLFLLGWHLLGFLAPD